MSGKNANLAFVFEADSVALGKLLDMPPGAVIEMVECDAARPGLLRFRVRGAGYPVREGEVIPTCVPKMQQWPLPNCERPLVTVSWPFSVNDDD